MSLVKEQATELLGAVPQHPRLRNDVLCQGKEPNTKPNAQTEAEAIGLQARIAATTVLVEKAVVEVTNFTLWAA